MLKHSMIAALASMAMVGSTFAAPVPGFEGPYNTVFTDCTLPEGGFSADNREAEIAAGLASCETAINGYADGLVEAVTIEVANVSFTELRSEVFAANEPDEEWQALVDALFELLLPDSGAIDFASPT